MRSMRGRFVLSHILPILLVVPLTAISLLYLLETQILLTEMSENITEKANIIAAILNDQPDLLQNTAEAESFITGLSLVVDENVFLFGPDGELLAVDEAATPSDIAEISDEIILEPATAGQENLVITYGLTKQRALIIVPVRDINQQLIGIVGVSDTLTSAASQFDQLRSLILIALILELILGALIGTILARRLEKPIGRTATAVVDIAHGRAIDPVPLEGPQEIRELAAAVNDLEERLRLLEETRRRSLANIVHELGRPLGAIRSATHVLRQGAGEDPEIREELLAGIEKAIENMQPLLDDLSLLHGQVQGKIELNRQPVNLAAWLPPILLFWRSAAQEKGLNWNADIPPNLPTLAIDPERLGQAVGNLLSNAVKYTPEGGLVTVTATEGEGEVTIAVQDTGPGIHPDEQQRIFEPFYRSQAERRFPQGLGLGLTIAHDLVAAHGGRLELASAPGAGSCFTIYLPQDGS